MPSVDSDGAPTFLVGMMGAGKTTIGERLAARLGRGFVDLDRLVESRAGASIATLFAAGGEAEFRELEHRALVELPPGNPVVATGGGVVLRPASVDHMLRHGRVIYLRANVATLLGRLGAAPTVATGRPLLDGATDRAQALTAILRDRDGAYARAHLIIDTDGLSVAQVLGAVLAAVGVA